MGTASRRGSRRRYAAAAALSCALVLAGCGGDTSGATDPSAEGSSASPDASESPTSGDSPTEPASDEPSGSEGPLVADPEHAVSPPGPRRGSLVPPDLLLTGRGSYAPVYEHLLVAARRSPELRARVREAAARVLALKARGALPPG